MERPKTRERPGNWSAARPNEGDNERWNGSPSRESTHDRGTDADVAADHAKSEIEPNSDLAPGTPAPGTRRRVTRH